MDTVTRQVLTELLEAVSELHQITITLIDELDPRNDAAAEHISNAAELLHQTLTEESP